jgi:hypothetical protein
MPLNNYQFQYNTFLFGGTGSPFQIINIDGLESLPDLRVQDDNRGYNDGMFTGRDFLGGRTITMEIHTFAGNGNSAFQNFNLLQAALIPSSQYSTPAITATTAPGLLQFLMSNSDSEMRIGARVRARQTSVNADYTYGFIRSQYTFFSPDPRYYGNALKTASLSPVTALGRGYNRIYPLVYGGGSGSVSTPLTNAGNVTTYPTITITGPATNITITNTTTGQYLSFAGSLLTGDTLVIDLNEKLITLNNVAARNLLLGGSSWFGVDVGTTNVSFFASGTVVGTTSCNINYRDAFI